MAILKTANKEMKGKFVVNFPRAITEFEKAFQKFPIKRILYNRMFRGRGLEFDSYRKFEQDDDSSFIDWRASLRADDLLARKYIEERDLNVYFIFDANNGMLFGSGEKLKAEYAAEMVVAIASLISDSGDKIGLTIFNKDIKKFLPPSNGRNQFALFTKFLSSPEFHDQGFNFEETIKENLNRVKSEYNVFILVSDFLNLKKSDEKVLRLLGMRFETIAIMVRDPLDDNLPKIPFQFSIQDPHSNKQIILDPKITEEKYREHAIKQKETVKEIFKKSKIDLLEVYTDMSFVNALVSFIKSRAKGVRI